MGTNKGWTVFFGGNGGARPRFGDIIARKLSATEARDCAERLLEYYRNHAKHHERTARVMERSMVWKVVGVREIVALKNG